MCLTCGLAVHASWLCRPGHSIEPLLSLLLVLVLCCMLSQLVLPPMLRLLCPLQARRAGSTATPRASYTCCNHDSHAAPASHAAHAAGKEGWEYRNPQGQLGMLCLLCHTDHSASVTPAGKEGWEYRDPQGQLHGPFRASQMIKW